MIKVQSKTIRYAGKLHISRAERFKNKKSASDFLLKVIEESIKNATKIIERFKRMTFCYGEMQMHSILVPALAKLTDYFIMEFPGNRENNIACGRIDYYCIKDPLHYFIELKCGRQGVPILRDTRKRNKTLWEDANQQLIDIKHDDNSIIRVAIEIITLYADKSKTINSQDLLDALYAVVQDFSIDKEIKPNLSVLWEFHKNIRNTAMDDSRESRKFYGLLFICRIMPLSNDK